jgi:PKHD-type hydroxylase
VYLTIANVLTDDEASSIRAAITKDDDSFVDGRTTAGWYARDVKLNEQVKSDKSRTILAMAEAALLQNAVFRAAAIPKKFVKLLVSRYRPGMQYGTHVDDVLMNGTRTDLSFTLFLSPLDSYDGGGLIVEGNDAEQEFRLAPGSLVLYPTTSLHRVAEITRGERLAIVGWVRSFVRDAGHREILFDLDNIIAALRTQKASRELLDRVFKVRANLLRLWAED